jgi:hypothetical protein
MLTNTQIATCQSIINIFETSAVLGEYGNVTVIDGDSGHLTFGRSQTTLGSGNLADLLERYCGNAGARGSDEGSIIAAIITAHMHQTASALAALQCAVAASSAAPPGS